MRQLCFALSKYASDSGSATLPYSIYSLCVNAGVGVGSHVLPVAGEKIPWNKKERKRKTCDFMLSDKKLCHRVILPDERVRVGRVFADEISSQYYLSRGLAHLYFYDSPE